MTQESKGRILDSIIIIFIVNFIHFYILPFKLKKKFFANI